MLERKQQQRLKEARERAKHEQVTVHAHMQVLSVWWANGWGGRCCWHVIAWLDQQTPGCIHKPVCCLGADCTLTAVLQWHLHATSAGSMAALHPHMLLFLTPPDEGHCQPCNREAIVVFMLASDLAGAECSPC